jgi:hypothetical protein
MIDPRLDKAFEDCQEKAEKICIEMLQGCSAMLRTRTYRYSDVHFKKRRQQRCWRRFSRCAFGEYTTLKIDA